MILALGDFNTRVGCIPGLEKNKPDTNRNFPMFMNFIDQVNLVIMNTLPVAKGLFTRFMKNGLSSGQSLLDYGLVDCDHVNIVTSFAIDEYARFNCGSDHALLECTLQFSSKPQVKWSYNEIVQYRVNENTDYSSYKEKLDNLIATHSLASFESLNAEEMLQHLSESVTHAARDMLEFKNKKKSKGVRLPAMIIKLINDKKSKIEQLKALVNKVQILRDLSHPPISTFKFLPP